jgi:hypothetical protein
MSYRAEVVADSISPDGVRLITMELEYPRFIHAEMLRHRVMSHAVMSSRAVPPEELIRRVREDPFVPETFNKRVKGMGVGEALTDSDLHNSRHLWLKAAEHAAACAWALNDVGVDKSRVNRLLEPFLWLHDIVTFTEYDNFFALRDNPAAQPEFQILARLMRESVDESEPVSLDYGQWHLPKITEEELESLCLKREAVNWTAGGLSQEQFEYILNQYKKVSVRRVARVSFDKHTDTEPWEDSIAKADTLRQSAHFSPFEMVARPFTADEWDTVHHIQSELDDENIPTHVKAAWIDQTEFCGNLRGWVQYRKEIPNESNFRIATAMRKVDVS